MDDVSRYGSVGVDINGRITGFSEKSQAGGRGLINAGLSLLSADFMKELPEGSYSMEQDIFPKFVSSAACLACARTGRSLTLARPKVTRLSKLSSAIPWLPMVRSEGDFGSLLSLEKSPTRTTRMDLVVSHFNSLMFLFVGALGIIVGVYASVKQDFLLGWFLCIVGASSIAEGFLDFTKHTLPDGFFSQ